VLLDADPLQVEPQFIKDIKVLETINNGKSIYSYQ
jgi:predicted amidohydrolase YtcJ